MTLPKDHSLPDDNSQNSTEPGLGESINELDNLITDAQSKVLNDNDSQIPVLDELVDPEYRHVNEIPSNNITPGQMSELVNTIDEKLTSELNALLDLLKDTIKDSIINEINTQLNSTDKNTNPPDQDR